MASGRMTRSKSNRIIAGVCAGLANHLGWPVERLRLVYVLLTLFSGAFPGVLIYLIFWVLMPED